MQHIYLAFYLIESHYYVLCILQAVSSLKAQLWRIRLNLQTAVDFMFFKDWMSCGTGEKFRYRLELLYQHLTFRGVSPLYCSGVIKLIICNLFDFCISDLKTTFHDNTPWKGCTHNSHSHSTMRGTQYLPVQLQAGRWHC